ncbi:MAG: substrate-binding domain-containing protein, partial [bacterium]|nr:substrate-binding domain-containing protein [bacterium]
MQHAADSAGVELLLANSDGKPDKEIQLVNTYITRKVDAIVISPLSATASVTALKRAREQGVAVVTYNSAVQGDIAVAHIESDQSDLGRQTGQVARRYIEERLGGKARVAVLAFKSQLPESSNGRRNGFVEEVTKLPGVEVVAEQDAWLPEMAIKKVGDILTANPDLDIVWAANEGGTIGAVMAVKNAGKGEQVAVFGTDTSAQLIDFLLSGDGILQAITGQQPFAIGSSAVRTALTALKGGSVAPTVSMAGVLLRRDAPA